MFAQLITQLPNRAIVATLPSPGRIAAKVNSVIAARVSRDLRVVETSVLGAGSWRGRLAADHFHANDHGYAAIAQTFEPTVIDAAIERRPTPAAHHARFLTAT